MTEDIYRHRPATAQRHTAKRFAVLDFCRSRNRFDGGSYAGTRATGIIASRGPREFETWKGVSIETRHQFPKHGGAAAADAGLVSTYLALEWPGGTKYSGGGHSLGGRQTAVDRVPARGVTCDEFCLTQFTPSEQNRGFDLGRPNAKWLLDFRSHADVVSRFTRHIGTA